MNIPSAGPEGHSGHVRANALEATLRDNSPTLADKRTRREGALLFLMSEEMA